MTGQQIIPPRARGVPVMWTGENPFAPTTAFAPAGLTIAEIVARTPGLPDAFAEHGVVAIGGHEIRRDYWHLVRPRCDGTTPVVVDIGLRLRGGGGGGGGKSPLRTVAMVALLVAAVAVGQFEVLGTLGTAFTIAGHAVTGAQLLAFGLSAAALAVGGVAASPSLPALQGTQDVAPQQAQAALSGNVAAPGAPAPMVAGAGMRIFPPLAAPVLVERVGLDQYAEAVFFLAGPHALWAPRFGDTAADQFPDVDLEIYNGLPDAPAPTLLQRYGYTQAVNAELVRHRVQADAQDRLYDQTTPSNSVPQWTPMASRTASDEVWITLALEGPADWNNPGATQVMPFRLQFRRRGDPVWINGVEFHYASKSGAAGEATVKIIFEAPAMSLPTPPSEAGFVAAFNNVPAQTVPPTTGGWQADGYFSAGAGASVYSTPSVGTTSVRAVSLYDDRIEIRLDPARYAPGAYEFRLMQGLTYPGSAALISSGYLWSGQVYDLFGFNLSGGFYSLPRTRANLNDKATVVRVASVVNAPPVAADAPFSLVAVRVKNQSLGQFSIMAAALIPTYDGAGWSGRAISSNPAEHFRALLAKALAYRQAPDSLIDDQDMLDWRQLCIDQDYRVNALIQSTDELTAMNLVASAGLARLREAERIGVAVDYNRSAEAPLMTFTERTMSDFAWTNPLADLPDGYLVKFVDEDDDFRQGSVRVLRPGAVDRGLYEETSNDASTNRAAVIARTTYDLRSLDQRMRFYTWKTNRKHIPARRNSLVGVSHDVLARPSRAARVEAVIASNDILAGVVVDAALPTPPDGQWPDPAAMWANPAAMWAAERFGLLIERLDGTISVHEIVPDPDGESRIALLAAPIADPGRDVIAQDCHVVAGALGRESLRLVVREIAYDEDLTATFNAVDVAPALFNPDGSIAV